MSDDRVRVLERRRVYSGKLLEVDRERVALPGGREADLETIRHPGAAAAIPFFDDGSVLLIRQYRHAAGGDILEVPAGKLDPGESPADCVRREVEEEVGWHAGRLEPLGSILTTPGFTDEVIWLFEAHELERGQLDRDDDELIEPVRWPFEQAVQAVTDGRIRDAKSVAAILHARLRRS
jgi:ADP-ribose pyrophosphatase